MTRLEARFREAVTLHQQGKLAEAERAYQDVLRQRPKHFDALHHLGVLALQSKRAVLGVQLIEKAISLNARNAAAQNNLGNGLRELGRFEAALACYDKAIAARPDYAEAWYNRGNALRDLGRAEDAIVSFQKAIALRPEYAEAHCNLAACLMQTLRHEDALESYDRALALRPNDAEAWYNRAIALQDLKRHDDALANYDKAIALRPGDADAHWNQSLCLLQMGEFERGWRLFEWRHKKRPPSARESFAQPPWLGETDIAGKAVFLHWEQGFGDTIQFCRYAELVRARGAKVIMSVQQPLRDLLGHLGPDIDFAGPSDRPAAFDLRCSLLSLPLAFRTTFATIPARVAYLRADPSLAAIWSERLAPTPRPRVGIAWSGSATNAHDHKRSIALLSLLPLLTGDVDWVCLQNEVRPADADLLKQTPRIAWFGEALTDFNETAALVHQLDLVVTVDTSVAHLAGAMGKPVWLLLQHNPDWRWLLDRDDSPWYPTVRLFRQPRPGEWDAVIGRVARELMMLTQPSARAFHARNLITGH